MSLSSLWITVIVCTLSVEIYKSTSPSNLSLVYHMHEPMMLISMLVAHGAMHACLAQV